MRVRTRAQGLSASRLHPFNMTSDCHTRSPCSSKQVATPALTR